VPFFDEKEVKLSRVLTDRGTEYCGNPEHHEYELYLAVEDIDHSRTKTKSPQTNGIVERLHKTMLNEFYRIAFRKKLYTSIGELQDDLVEECPPSSKKFDVGPISGTCRTSRQIAIILVSASVGSTIEGALVGARGASIAAKPSMDLGGAILSRTGGTSGDNLASGALSRM
jgi:hypothetical protein